MDNTVLVRMRHAFAYLKKPLQGFDGCPGGQVFQRAVFAKRRYEIRYAALILAIINDFQDVRVIEFTEDLNFLLKTRAPLWIARLRRGQ